MNIMDDRARWTMLLRAITGAWCWKITGGRGVINQVTVQAPPESDQIGLDIRVTL